MEEDNEYRSKTVSTNQKLLHAEFFYTPARMFQRRTMYKAKKSRRGQNLFTSGEEYILLARTIYQFTPAEVTSVVSTLLGPISTFVPSS